MPQFTSVASSETTSTEYTKRKEVLIEVNEDAPPQYQIRLKRDGNRVLTPLEIFNFDEIASGTTKNKEIIDIRIYNSKQPADSVSLEVLNDTKIIYAEQNTKNFLPNGESIWQWDGYDSTGVLDSKTLKSPDLKIRLTAKKGSLQQIVEMKLHNKAQEVDWVDAKINRKTKQIEITVRPSFSDGGIEGNSTLKPTPYPELEKMAKEGIERYWSRDGSRPGGIGNAIDTAKGSFQVKVTADVNTPSKAGNFPLIEKIDKKFGRSTSLGMFRKIIHSVGFWTDQNLDISFADEDFRHTSAHEFGHLILNAYGGGGLLPKYSWTHKSTSTLAQEPIPNNPSPKYGEIDVMHYDSDTERNFKNYWSRAIASEQDVKGLLWLTRVQFCE